MDIGEQQRVIIVEVDESMSEPAPQPDQQPSRAAEDAAAWPLPLDLDPEPVS